MKKISFSAHFAALAIVTILCGLVYAAVQQAHRSGANDPQLQVALDLRNSIENNHPAAQWLNSDSLDLSQSLSLFKVLYNNRGEPIAATGFLDGQYPRLPLGVFDFTRSHGEDVFTWQPRYGVRMAMVLEAVNSRSIAFVAVGRSLKEIEKREAQLRTMVIVAWLVCAGIIVLHLLGAYAGKRAASRRAG